MLFDILSPLLCFSILFMYWFSLFVFLCKVLLPANGSLQLLITFSSSILAFLDEHEFSPYWLLQQPIPARYEGGRDIGWLYPRPVGSGLLFDVPTFHM